MVNLTGSCFLRLLPPFTGQEILDVFFLLYFVLALASDPEYLSHSDPSLASAALGSSSSPNVSGRSDLPENMSDKGRGRTSRYLYVVRPVEVSFDPGGLASASWVTPGGTSRGLVNGGSTGEGLRLMVGETCTRRLAPMTTWVDLPTINPFRASSAPLIGYA